MEDTIVSVATPPGNGGIAIIRISGQEAISVANSIFRGVVLTDVPSHTIHYGHIVKDDIIIDEVLVSVMRAPKTYTTEDVVEVNTHGGSLITERVLETIIDTGARLAEPGEFTKRAFLGGRIDLSQAESVMELIQAKNQIALNASLRQLSGSVGHHINAIRDILLREIAYLEAAMDDPEHYDLSGYGSILSEKIEAVQQKLTRWICTSKDGQLVKEGIKTAIIGLPNAGKSSLLNYLAKTERAIVTDIAGTTRDTIEETVRVGDVLLDLIDTAGIRDSDDIVEQLGVMRSKQAMQDAKLILYVIDATKPLTKDNDDLFEAIGEKHCIVLLNKCDQEQVVKKNMIPVSLERIVTVSLTKNEGMENLVEIIRTTLQLHDITREAQEYLANERQRSLLQNASDALTLVQEAIVYGMPEDCWSIDLTEAYRELGKILGKELEEDVVNRIFSEFCMGK